MYFQLFSVKGNIACCMKVVISTVVFWCNADSSCSEFGQCRWVVKSFLLENSVRVGKNGMDIVC